MISTGGISASNHLVPGFYRQSFWKKPHIGFGKGPFQFLISEIVHHMSPETSTISNDTKWSIQRRHTRGVPGIKEDRFRNADRIFLTGSRRILTGEHAGKTLQEKNEELKLL